MQKIILSGIALIFIALSTLAGCTTVIRTPPPPAKVEVRPEPPFPNAVWISGHWEQRRGNWVWAPGYWIKRPGPKAIWVPGHWEKRPRGWIWNPGHWRR